MKRNIMVLLAVETVLVLVMAFFADYNGLIRDKKYLIMICWRIALALPVIMIALDSLKSNPSAYTRTMLVTLLLIFAADIAIIFKFEAGLGVFLVVHAVNTVNFTRLSKKAGLMALPGLIVLAGGYFLYKTTIEAHLESPAMGIALQVYLFVIILSFWRALETAGTSGKAFTAMISAGTLVFFIGDYFVARDVFLNEEYHQIVNNTLYYVPHVLLGLSTAYYRGETGGMRQ